MKDDDFCTVQERRCRAAGRAPPRRIQLWVSCFSQGGTLSNRVRWKVYAGSPHPLPSTLSLFPLPSGMHKSPHVSPRRLSDISPQLRQLKYLVVDEAIKEDLKSSRSVEDINSASIEERILRITGYYGYQPWRASYTSESLYILGACCFVWVCGWSRIQLDKVFFFFFLNKLFEDVSISHVNSALYAGKQKYQNIHISQKNRGREPVIFSIRSCNCKATVDEVFKSVPLS